MGTEKIASTIFLISSERSGTNLIRSVLNNHSQIHFPHNPGIIPEFLEIQKNYTDIQEFVEDVLGLIHANHNPWDWVPSKKALLDKVHEVDVFQVKKAIYELLAEHYGVEVIGFKNIQIPIWVDELLKHFPQPVFLYQYRDPRDVAASWMGIPLGPKHVFFSAERWRKEQEGVYNNWDRLKKKGELIFWKYEGFLSNPHPTLRSICEKIGISQEEERMLNFYESQDAQKSSQSFIAWENLSKPLDNDNYKNYKGILSSEEVFLIEQICYPYMKWLGYDTEFSIEELRDAPFPGKDKIQEFERLNAQRRHENYLQSSPQPLKERKDRYRKWLHEKHRERGEGKNP